MKQFITFAFLLFFLCANAFAQKAATLTQRIKHLESENCQLLEKINRLEVINKNLQAKSFEKSREIQELSDKYEESFKSLSRWYESEKFFASLSNRKDTDNIHKLIVNIQIMEDSSLKIMEAIQKTYAEESNFKYYRNVKQKKDFSRLIGIRYKRDKLVLNKVKIKEMIEEKKMTLFQKQKDLMAKVLEQHRSQNDKLYESNLKLKEVVTSQKRAIFLIIIMLAIIIAMFWRIKRQNANLKITNTKLIKQNQLIESQNLQIKAQQSELHHRVNNNLQSLINYVIKKHYSKDSNTKQIAQGFVNHIREVGKIQNRIYMKDENDNLQRANTQDYIQNLAKEVMRFFKYDEMNSVQTYEIEAYHFSLENMIAIGFIVNECVTNACKHAFDDTEKPILHISLIKRENDYQMTIQDNGKKEVKSLVRDGSEGSKIIATNLKQLYGTHTWHWQNGLSINIIFSPQN